MRWRFWQTKNTLIPAWLWWGVFALVGAIFAAGCWKYAMFAYNALDLAIYNQVFWKTVHGEIFGMTIHPHSYLGDHAELALLLLAPLYALWQDPRMLILLQAIALAAPAVVLWLIVHERGRKMKVDEEWVTHSAVLLSLAWLASSTVHSIGLFEFHLLPFTLLPILCAALAYEKNSRTWFIVAITAAMLVREDVALVIMAFGALAWMERKPLWWRWFPIAAGAAWLSAAMFLTAQFRETGSYKFMIYYAWLGDSPFEIVAGIFLHPLRLLVHVMTMANLEMILALLMPLIFLPLIKPQRLILLALPLAQILLGAPGGGANVAQMHYATLFLPALFLADADGLLNLPRQKGLLKAISLDARDIKPVITITLVFSLLYCIITMSPLAYSVKTAFDSEMKAKAAIAREAIAVIAPDAAVAASYDLLPHLSGRDTVYSLHYLFLGKTQFAENDYAVPRGLTHLAINADDFLSYRAQFTNTGWTKALYESGDERIAELIGPVVWQKGPYAIVQRERNGKDIPVTAATGAEVSITNAKYVIDRNRDTMTFSIDTNVPYSPSSITVNVALRDNEGNISIGQDYPLISPLNAPQAFGRNAIDIELPTGGIVAGIYHPTVTLSRPSCKQILDRWLTAVRDCQAKNVIQTMELAAVKI